MNTLSTHQARVGYTHCPHCNKLDRIFYIDLNRDIICQECKKGFTLLEGVMPDRSETWHARKVQGEIVIVKNSDLHGRISAGWFGESKILIGETTCPELEIELMDLAEREAKKRNRKII